MNAKEEFLEEIEGRKLICANIQLRLGYNDSKFKTYTLNKAYTKKDLAEFIESLNFVYDDGYGGQELFGVILFENSYSDRHEYDGAESWQHHQMPTVEDVISFFN